MAWRVPRRWNLPVPREVQEKILSMWDGRPRVMYVESRYLLHEGWPVASGTCEPVAGECMAGEYVSLAPFCCDELHALIGYPSIGRVSLARYRDLGPLLRSRGGRLAVKSTSIGWGEPYEFYLRFEFDTGKGAESYKLGSTYYYRLEPGEAGQTYAGEERAYCLRRLARGLGACNALDEWLDCHMAIAYAASEELREGAAL